MTVFLARQPILDANLNVFGYELFYRSGFTNHYTGVNADEASTEVIVDTFQSLGLSSLTDGKPAFINFSTALLQREIATLFPAENLVIEILETVVADENTVQNCRRLKEAGYKLALDDFAFQENLMPLLDLADIIKIDLQAVEGNALVKFIQPLKDKRYTLLAEKVETWDQFRLTRDIGFRLFQGYFFSRPEIVTAKKLDPLQISCLRLISKVNEPEFDFDELAEIISRDVSLSYSLIRLVNSAAFAKRETITSIKHALVYLGEREIRKWVSLVALRRISVTKPGIAVVTSMVRARFIELLAARTKWRPYQGLLFLAGLFSLLDVLLQKPMPDILEEIAAPAPMQELLIYGTGPFQDLWEVVLAYEKGRWRGIEDQAAALALAPRVLTEAYLEAVQWSAASAA